MKRWASKAKKGVRKLLLMFRQSFEIEGFFGTLTAYRECT
jgi:hypothetical protein